MKHLQGLVVAVLVGAVAACAGPPKPASTSMMTRPADSSASTGLLGIGELKFYYRNHELGMHLHPDGKLEKLVTQAGADKPTTENWVQLAVLSADGRMSVGEKTVGQLQPDGTFHVADGRTAPFKIEGDALVASGKRLSFDSSGQLLVDGAASDPPLRVEGITNANTKRTALLILAMSLPGGA